MLVPVVATRGLFRHSPLGQAQVPRGGERTESSRVFSSSLPSLASNPAALLTVSHAIFLSESYFEKGGKVGVFLNKSEITVLSLCPSGQK